MKFFISFIFTLALIWALQTKLNDIPPLGKFLSPSDGFWQNAESKHFLVTEDLKLGGLKGKVVVKYDDRMIPHIFAGNDHDLYYAQGFVTARDRLWEMDVQTRSASGRLAEVIGPKALAIDRYRRRMGMVYGAENTLRGMMKDTEVKQMLEAYTNGVNGYIHSLSKRGYPIEFKLLDYAPEDWKPINCVFLLKLMSETLAGGSDQFAMTNTLKRFGAAATNDLFPDNPMHQDPIIPAGTPFNFKPLPIPKPSAGFISQTADTIKTKQRPEGIGSNNWVIAGNKTASGYPMLANDPHLNLTFPSIWYQMQLSSPTVNVYGVTLPGSPCVIIGYNQKISWGVTNVGASVLDWYKIKFKDQQKNEYWYNNAWHKVSKRIEKIEIRGEKPVYDTVIYTHHGPVVYETNAQKPAEGRENVPAGNALRWIAHDESNDIKTFYLLNRANNYDDYRKSLSYFTAPAQNFIFADARDIAITPNGKFPLKYKDQGKFILDGSDPADDWHGFIPFDQNPTAKNPAQGFLNSANQTLTDATYPYYLNWDFGAYERGKRINDRLAAMKMATVDSMRLLQTDNYSIQAQDVLPALIKYLDTSKLDEDELKALNAVKKWDKRFDANSTGASIFNRWWLTFDVMLWNNKFADNKTLLDYPSRDRTEQLLLKEPGSRWFDDISTPAKETCADIVNHAFVKAVAILQNEHGPIGPKWQWGLVKKTYIDHLASLPGFGAGNFVAGGTGMVINALRGNNGPSWRMVVQLGPEVKGYGIFPGGESGNPGSFNYDDMLQTWKDGKLDGLLFLKSASENSKRIKSTLTISPK